VNQVNQVNQSQKLGSRRCQARRKEPEMWDANGPIKAAEHAGIILEVCGGDLDQAREVCVTNMIGDLKHLAYWQSVFNTLTVGGAA
jgi:hypothetical protein